MKVRWMACCLCLWFLCSAPAGHAEGTPKSNPKRDHALELYKEGRLVDAMALLEDVATENPNDVGVMESWGASVLGYAQTLPDPELRKKSRVRARSILLRAKELGDNSDLLQTLLRGLPEDGSFSSFSDNKEVEQAMQQAEADFARGDVDKARQSYMRAYLLDPTQYYAALFIGDTFFRQQQPVFAEEWFSKAAQINSNIETAYRYWGDALLGQGKLEDARSKYIEAVVADPYNQNSWGGLKKWLERTKMHANWLKITDRVGVELKDGKTKITLDNTLPKDDQVLMGGWMSYGMSRALWMSEKFAKQYPTEKSYRHSLKEEADSLHMLIAVALEVAAKQKQSLTGSDFGTLADLEKSGLLQPFVLLNRADDGIAKDYPGYRDTNRDSVRRYLNEFVVPKTPATVDADRMPTGS